jgi:hypothetical protein
MWKPWAWMGRNGFRRVERWAAVACPFGDVSQATSIPLRCSHTRFPGVLRSWARRVNAKSRPAGLGTGGARRSPLRRRFQ